MRRYDYDYEPAFSRRCYAHILIVFAPRKRLRSLMEGRKKLRRKQPKLSTGQTLPASQSLTQSARESIHLIYIGYTSRSGMATELFPTLQRDWVIVILTSGCWEVEHRFISPWPENVNSCPGWRSTLNECRLAPA